MCSSLAPHVVKWGYYSRARGLRVRHNVSLLWLWLVFGCFFALGSFGGGFFGGLCNLAKRFNVLLAGESVSRSGHAGSTTAEDSESTCVSWLDRR